MSESSRVSLPVLATLLLGAASSVVAQEASTELGPLVEEEPRSEVRFTDPYEAYAAGAYDQALQRFVDYQIERPEDPAVALNVGSVQYELRNFEAADEAFSKAAFSGDPSLRGQALYNLGNSAYRQGRLEEAVGLYKAALEVDPDDEDAKFNLEFVRDEIRRRHEEAQKRQQEQQQQGDQQQQQDGQGQQEPQQGEDQQPQQQPGEEQQGSDAADQDGDGLSDELERQAENPTDPANPDTDQDGLADGQEDENRNGRVDEGETDPNRADSDGDGVSDGAERAAAEGGQAAEAPAQGELSEEEAERFLQALEEGRPDPERKVQGKAVRRKKDW